MRKRNRIISVMLCIPIMLTAISFEAPASALPAFAIPGDTTIADVVLGMLTGSGALPINTEWLTSLESAFGSTLGTIEDFVSNGLISESGGSFFDSGLASVIESMPEYESLGLDNLFSVGAEEAATAGVSAVSGGAFLSGQTLLGMNVGAMGIGTGVLGGVGLGILANHIISNWGKQMGAGVEITLPDNLKDYLIDGGYVRTRLPLTSNNYSIYYYPGGTISGCYALTNNTAEYQGLVVALNGKAFTFKIMEPGYNSPNSYTSEQSTFLMRKPFTDGFTLYNSRADFMDFVSKVRSGEEELPPIVSPDVIGPDGKTPHTYNPDDGYTFPTIQPQFNPSEEGIKPIPYEVVAPLPALIDADPDSAGDLYHDLIDDYVIPITPPETEPGGDPDPDPGQNPYLDPDAIPEQPEYEPKQSEISETEIGEAGPYTTPNLMERFPFCIPNDILSIFSKFKSARQAPSISWRFYVEDFGIDYTFNLDLSDFDDVAELLRLLELILFVVGLAVATRYLIGG